ncbi:hypothetical protein [Salinivibrio kushneri]|uniref:hypothetical protein n=1 Tax=Salinivibrio kushneri TaxID=1908198 RepID=UPI0022B405AD|nr:hypothetical protein [Salinivibrio kushneri]WBA13445.1 hypothetical protein O4546_14025 [Salinivibrio kushneri]
MAADKRRRESAKGAARTIGEQLVMDGAILSNELSVLSPSAQVMRGDVRANRYKFKVPKCFDLFSAPEAVLQSIAKFRAAALNSKVATIEISHRKVQTSSLASEVLLGVLAREIRNTRQALRFTGVFPVGRARAAKKRLIHTGLLKHLIDPDDTDAKENSHGNDVHVYRAENRFGQASSSTSDDKKTEVARDCVEHLEGCLNQHELSLTGDAKKRLRACVGEILDNASEHCGRTSEVWNVHSYLDDSYKRDRFFELCVFNIGRTIAESFEALGDDSETKKEAFSYVQRHIHHDDLSQESLLTVKALQGSVSSKRDEDITRGQGTVTLIETFEAIYQAYCALRVENHDDAPMAQMNLISGTAAISFDSTYPSKTVEHEGGGESFVVSFNGSNSLKDKPDSYYVRTMGAVKFPGVMINIRIPLQGSTSPLSHED